MEDEISFENFNDFFNKYYSNCFGGNDHFFLVLQSTLKEIRRRKYSNSRNTYDREKDVVEKWIIRSLAER